MIQDRTQNRCPAKAHLCQLVNTEALLTNWEIGQYISMQLRSSIWGARVVSDLADYLKRQNPKRRGFGKRHLYNMVKFYETYSREEFANIINGLKLSEIVQLAIAQFEETFSPMPQLLTLVPFTGHLEIMNRCRDRRGTYFQYALCILSKVKKRRIAEMYCQSNLFYVDGERKNTVTEDVCRISE